MTIKIVTQGNIKEGDRYSYVTTFYNVRQIVTQNDPEGPVWILIHFEPGSKEHEQFKNQEGTTMVDFSPDVDTIIIE